VENRFRKVGDAALVAAVRRGDPEAIDEFLGRFQEVVMSQAKLLRVPPVEWRSWTSDLLCDVVVGLIGKTGASPRSVVAYLITSARNRHHAVQREWALHQRRLDERATALGGAERVLATACSEFSVRTTYAPDWEPAPLPPVLDRLVVAMEHSITPEERRLLSWVAQRTSFSTIARMLGEQRSTIVKRVTRLRARLIEAALRFGESLATRERAELVRFLRRTGAYDAAALEALARGERQMKEYPMRQTRPKRRGEEPIDDIAR
jgi:DNA-binding CsgD family transcriptional regulator